MKTWNIEHAYIVPCQLAQMRSKGILTDICLVVQGRAFDAHKLVLAAMSPYFQGLFMSQMTESRAKTLEFEDIDSEIFEEILSFMYTGEAKVRGLVAAVKLLATADRFLMADLVRISLQLIKDQATTLDFPWLLVESRSFHMCDLEAFAFSKCCEHFSELSKGPALGIVPCSMFCKLLQSDFLVLYKEEDVLAAAIIWLGEKTVTFTPEFAETEGAVLSQDQRHEVLSSVRFSCIDAASLPNFWPQLLPHCQESALAQRVLCGLGRFGKEAESPRWLLRGSSVQELGRDLCVFATQHYEYGQLGVTLLTRKKDSALVKLAIQFMQDEFESSFKPKQEEGSAESCSCSWAAMPWAGFLTGLLSANYLALVVVQKDVVPCIKRHNHEEARLLLCELAHSSVQKCELKDGNQNENIKTAIKSITSTLDDELPRAQSPWLKLQLQRAITRMQSLMATW